MPICVRCQESPVGNPLLYRPQSAVKRSFSGRKVCKACFFTEFEDEIHEFIQAEGLLRSGEHVTIGASGGKDSTVLLHILHTLNERHGYGVHLSLLSIDEGISGYRDGSLESVRRNAAKYSLPLHIYSYNDLYGYTMDEIAQATNRKGCCTFCGVFRRQALDRGAALIKACMIATGHNADDIAETVLMNMLRGDISRLSRCTDSRTGEEESICRVKPLKMTYEKEIVFYAYFKKLDYFSTECCYAPEAYRGYARDYLKQVERLRPQAILGVIRSGGEMKVGEDRKQRKIACSRCGYMSSQACFLLDGLRRGNPVVALGKRKTGETVPDES